MMAHFINTRTCPTFVVSYVRSNLKSDELAYKHKPRVFFDFLGRPRKDRYDGIYEVRWLSRFVEKTLTCTGTLLGRWIVGPTSVKPMNTDFARGEVLDVNNDAIIVNYWYPVIVEFAIDERKLNCNLSRIGHAGDVSCYMYELPYGMETKRLGQPVGPLAKRKVFRWPGYECPPIGWTR